MEERFIIGYFSMGVDTVKSVLNYCTDVARVTSDTWCVDVNTNIFKTDVGKKLNLYVTDTEPKNLNDKDYCMYGIVFMNDHKNNRLYISCGGLLCCVHEYDYEDECNVFVVIKKID